MANNEKSCTTQAFILNSDDSTHDVTDKATLFLYVTNVIVCLEALAVGISVTWASSQLPKLNGNVEPELNPLPEPLTTAQEAWIASISQVGILCGAPVVKYVDNRFGRKGGLQFYGVLYALTYITLAFSRNVELFYFARFFDGFLGTGILALSAGYILEITFSKRRGFLSCIREVHFLLGMYLGLVLGPLFTVKTFNLLCTLPILVSLIGFVLVVPKTPVDLVRQGRFCEVEDVLMKLRKKGREQVGAELETIVKYVKENSSKNTMHIKHLFATKASRRALFISLTLSCLIALTGFDVVMAYLQTIFQLANTGLSSYTSLILVGFGQVLGGVGTAVFIDKIGRRKLLMISSGFCGLSIATLGLYFYLKENSFNVEALFWLPLTSLLVYVFNYSLGIGFLPFVITSELFLPSLTAIAIASDCFFHCISNFVALFTFSYLRGLLGVEIFFVLYTGMCIFTFGFTYFIVPETKGKSFQEIQAKLEN